MKNSLIRWTVLLCVGLVIGLGIKFVWVQNELDSGVIPVSADDANSVTILKQPESRPSEGVAGAQDVGGDFEMIDQNGKTVTQADYPDYKLIFFGFTHCPAICPTELQKITLALETLGDAGNIITPIFVTLDPERDTPEQIKEYLGNFHPRMVGLTGSAEQVTRIKDNFRVFSRKVEAEFMDGYMVDHSAFTYLMDRENKMIAIYPSSDSAQDIADDIKKRNLN